MNDKILDKLKKIKAHMESAQAIGSQDEASAFAAMLQNLLLKHKLDMTDVEYAAEQAEDPIVEDSMPEAYRADGKKVYRDFPDVEIRGAIVDWVVELGCQIARFHSCEIMVGRGTSKLWFVGHRSNVQIVQYLFIVLHRAAEKLADKAYGVRYHECLAAGDATRCRGFRKGFLTGFVQRITERFREELTKAETQYGEGLVRVNKESLAVKQYMEQRKDKKTAQVSKPKAKNGEGYRQGRAAANSMSLKANAFYEGQPNRQKELA